MILRLIDQKPSQHYIVAVDDSKNTLEDIVKVSYCLINPNGYDHIGNNGFFTMSLFIYLLYHYMCLFI